LNPPTSSELSGIATEAEAPGIRLIEPEVKDRSPAKEDTAMVPMIPEKVVSPVFSIWK
jgi:hypothetical protein